jgi:hypothetical protein
VYNGNTTTTKENEMPTYKVQFQMVDTFEIEIDEASTMEEARKIVRAELDAGNGFHDDRNFISWDIGTVRVVERLDK